MKIKFWGVRGSIPSPLLSENVRGKIRKAFELARDSNIFSATDFEKFLDSLPLSINGTYGSNTACIEVRSSNELLIFDAGSGIRVLGLELMKEGFASGGKVIHILLTHTHWDHIQGFPFFVPAYIPGNKIQIYNPKRKIEERIKAQQFLQYFPVSIKNMSSEIQFNVISENNHFKIGDLNIYVKKLVHPGDSYSYKVVSDSGVFVYSTDVEYFNLGEDVIDELKEFFSCADVLVFDAQYTLEESLKKIEWGHSAAVMAVDIAMRSNVKKLVLFHHDPTYSDEKIETMERKAKEYRTLTDADSKLEILAAYEGLEIEI